MTKNLNITIYGKPDCSQCTAAKNFLDRHGNKYDYIDVMAGDISSDDIKHLTTVIAPGAKSFPIIIINGHFIGTTEHLYGIFQ